VVAVAVAADHSSLDCLFEAADPQENRVVQITA
jgi:hypothetical protein